MVPCAPGASRHQEVNEPEDENELRVKRQRVAAACDQCRVRKVRCDAQKPVCGPCIRRNGSSATCEWGIRRGRGSAIAKKDEILRLSRRIEEFERKKPPTSSNDDVRHEFSSTQDYGPTTTSPSQNRMIDDNTRSGPSIYRPLDASGDAPDDFVENSAMMGFAGNTGGAHLQQYSDSSINSFMNHIRGLVDQELTPSNSHESSTSSRTPFKRSNSRKSTRLRQLQDYILPSRQRADYLLSVYKELVATLYPFLDMNDVEILYGRLWTGEDLGDEGPAFLCLINVVFAIACKLDSTLEPPERSVVADVFYTRAHELLQVDVSQQRSLLSIQCFLLLGQYLQGTNDPEQCWIYVGLAVRIAQSLRLDITATSARESPNCRELYRRVWHGCVLMDQSLSMTSGRPAMIAHGTKVPLPLAHDIPVVCSCFTEDLHESSPTDYHFFIETLKLYNIMNETLHTLYSLEPRENLTGDPNYDYFGIPGAQAVGNLLDMDQKLKNWYENLPRHLRYEAGSDLVSVHHRQSNVLFFRYIHVRILLFRPVLARYCSRSVTQVIGLKAAEDCLPTKVALQLSLACVKAAVKTIERFDVAMAGRELEEFDEILPAWWYGIFYVYTAATVLIAARLNATLFAEVGSDTISTAWKTIIKIMRCYQELSNEAERCLTTLNLLLSQGAQLDQQQAAQQDYGGLFQTVTSSPMNGSEHPTAGSDGVRTVVTAVHTENWAASPGGFRGPQRDTPLVKDVIKHFNTAGVSVDIFGDMSWLTSLPSQRY